MAGASESLAEGNTVELVTEIIVEQLSITADQVRPESKIIEDLGADFTDAVELVMAVEEEFGIEVPDEEAEKFISVSDIISYVEKALLRNSESNR
ncbi:acyl carrier protein [Akkermansiaceae bacterium]|nr:acyl carrier protein [Akkermansiaceae bacterium]